MAEQKKRSKLPYASNRGGAKLTRAREWGSELRAREVVGHNLPFPANSAPMKARITNFLREVIWLKISIVCNVGNPKSVSSRSNKFE